MKIVLGSRKQLSATSQHGGLGKNGPGAGDRAGVTAVCWGGSTVFQVAATNPDMRQPWPVWPPRAPIPISRRPVTASMWPRTSRSRLLSLSGERHESLPADARKMGIS